MRPRDVVELVVLAALWGASFLFMRMGAAGVRPGRARRVRVAGAALLLLPLLAVRGELGIAAHATGGRSPSSAALNSALPFLLLRLRGAVDHRRPARRSSTRRRRCSARSSPGCWLKRPADAAARRRPGDRLRRRALARLGQGRLRDAGGSALGDPRLPGRDRAATASRRASPSAISAGVAAARRRRRQPARGGASFLAVPALLVVAGTPRLRRAPGSSRRCSRSSAPARLHPVLPPDRQRRAGERDRGDLPDPGLRRALGLAVPRRAASRCRCSPAAPSSSSAPRSRPESSGRGYRNDRYDKAACGTVARPAARCRGPADANRRLPTPAEPSASMSSSAGAMPWEETASPGLRLKSIRIDDERGEFLGQIGFDPYIRSGLHQHQGVATSFILEGGLTDYHGPSTCTRWASTTAARPTTRCPTCRRCWSQARRAGDLPAGGKAAERRPCRLDATRASATRPRHPARDQRRRRPAARASRPASSACARQPIYDYAGTGLTRRLLQWRCGPRPSAGLAGERLGRVLDPRRRDRDQRRSRHSPTASSSSSRRDGPDRVALRRARAGLGRRTGELAAGGARRATCSASERRDRARSARGASTLSRLSIRRSSRRPSRTWSASPMPRKRLRSRAFAGTPMRS